MEYAIELRKAEAIRIYLMVFVQYKKLRLMLQLPVNCLIYIQFYLDVISKL